MAGICHSVPMSVTLNSVVTGTMQSNEPVKVNFERLWNQVMQSQLGVRAVVAEHVRGFSLMFSCNFESAPPLLYFR